jgi:hypothetical protein
MKLTSLLIDPKIVAFSRRTEVAVEEPLQFFVVPTSMAGLLWLAKQRLLGRKLTNPKFNKATNIITGAMAE